MWEMENERGGYIKWWENEWIFLGENLRQWTWSPQYKPFDMFFSGWNIQCLHAVKQKHPNFVAIRTFTSHRSWRKPLSIQTMMLVACLRSPAAAMDKAPWPDLRDTTRKMKTEHESTPLEKENRGLLYSYSPPTVNLVNLHFVGISD